MDRLPPVGRVSRPDRGRSYATAAAALLCALLIAAVPGQEPPPPDTKAGEPAAAEERKASEEPVHIEHADLLSYDPEKNLYFLTGNVHFRQEETHLYCDEAQYNEDEDTARATGNLKLVQPETTVTGDLITADFGEKFADIIGNVRLVTQKKKEEPKPEGEGAPKAEGEEAPKAENPPAREGEQKEGRWEEHKTKVTTVTCDQIRYWYDEKRALATGSVVAVQEDKKVTADEAEYVEKDDLLTLKGNPVQASMEDGSQFAAPWVKVEVEGERFWTGPIIGIFKRERKEEAKPGEEQPTPPPTPQPPEQPKAP